MLVLSRLAFLTRASERAKALWSLAVSTRGRNDRGMEGRARVKVVIGAAFSAARQ